MARARSAQLFSDAKNLIPGGVNSPARAWGSVGGDPIFIKKAAGSRIWDVDGNELIDYVCSWGPMVLGHAHPAVIDAAIDATRSGTSFGAPTELEVEMARRVVDAVPSIEVVRFVSSGTEATMSALRLARAKTGRYKILKFNGGYHGHEDALLVEAGSGLANQGIASSAGVHPEYAASTLVAEFNDVGSVRLLLEANAGEVAAVIVEPIAGNMGVVTPEPGFLEGLRELTTEHGALLIFDEVISGFRVALGGAQSIYGITPDITCLGKIIGGGFPVGAYGASEEIMSEVAPLGPMYQAGTLSGNPVAMAAGIATIDELSKPGVYEGLEASTDKLADELLGVFDAAGIRAVVNRACGLLTVFFTENPVIDMGSASATDRESFGAFFHGM
ncbi:MAG: glutamate-1-semialdehyde 2,1-aminomutase, partial [Chloroflexi bacterium]|nr:glutamate-1-semialdehyde 2,1-aminomutase [Chloroflexota bacterium]